MKTFIRIAVLTAVISSLSLATIAPVLAQAVTLLRSHFSSEPIIFWMSKAKSVVAQTYSNFSAGGKYSEIVDGFRIINIAQLTPMHIEDGSTPLMIMATTGLFNNRDQSEGALNIYKKDADLFGDSSPWERLIARKTGAKRRPLLIVYDEGHNLSEQQTEILSELEPDGTALIQQALSTKKPVILIKGNMLKNETDRSLYNGLKNLLETIVSLYRNPTAHSPKLFDVTSETDAITAFNMMSLAHRILDNCINIRDLDNQASHFNCGI